MNILKSKPSKAVALALAAVVQVYVSGGFVLAAPKAAEPAVKAAARQEIQGRLTTTGDNPVNVNGNSARTGETIFSGQQIQTPAGTRATVELPGLGSVDIAPGSTATVTFAQGRINVVVASGCASVRANDAVTGTLQSSGGTETTGAGGGTVDNCDAGAAGAMPAGGASGAGATGGGVAGGAATGGGLGSGTALALTAAVVGAFSLIAYHVISDSDNPEPQCTPIPANSSVLVPGSC